MANDVRLTDLEVIQRYSIAVRGETADREELLAALRADVAWLERAGAPKTAPAGRPAPARRSAAKPAAKGAEAAKPARPARPAKPAKAARR